VYCNCNSNNNNDSDNNSVNNSDNSGPSGASGNSNNSNISLNGLDTSCSILPLTYISDPELVLYILTKYGYIDRNELVVGMWQCFHRAYMYLIVCDWRVVITVAVEGIYIYMYT